MTFKGPLQLKQFYENRGDGGGGGGPFVSQRYRLYRIWVYIKMCVKRTSPVLEA